MSASWRAVGARVQLLASALAARPIFWLVFIAAVFAWPIVRAMHAGRDLPHTPPVLGRARDFTLRDHQGHELGAAELRGRIWVASFTSLHCEPQCASSEHLMKSMAEVRHRTRNLGDAIRLLTFTADPERDTAERMLERAAAYRASGGSWRFVSGPPARVRDVLRDFQVEEGSRQTRVALVDDNSLVRGYYDLDDEAAIPVLLRDISLLLVPGRE